MIPTKQDTRRQIFGVGAITGGFRVFLNGKIGIEVQMLLQLPSSG
jgi:hypothetical protein